MTGAEIGALAVAAAGTYASVSAQQEQADQQRAILNRQLDGTDKASKKVAELVNDEAQNFAPTTRADALDAAAAAADVRSKQDLEGAGGSTIATAADPGNVSKDFLTAKADRAVTEGTRLTSLGRELAKIRAPGLVTTNDGFRSANLGSNISDVLGSNSRMAGANTLDAQSVQAPAYGGLGQLATALGTAYASGQIAKGAGAAGAASSGAGLSPYTLSGTGLKLPSAQIAWGG